MADLQQWWGAQQGAQQLPSVLQVFALLLAAVVHDVDHPGLTNDFLGRTGHPIAQAYGKCGSNEQHHLATAYSVLSHPHTDMLSGMSPAEAGEVLLLRWLGSCSGLVSHKRASGDEAVDHDFVRCH